ncbi:hypothetical protein BpHYR1_022042 [Brachionus plicatilis]|uniref:Uncharacterized protein n=1 Tax=Brachionus plicatilis TaxID=10195 RepID=A0A3M7PKY5_BRAPC|nr:hypothetical protein BpHYR1_022042 [Brachionus plicatilis]
MSRKWIGPYTILRKQGEHNSLIRPDVKGKKRLVHVNNLKRCYSAAENVRYETIIDTTDADIMGKEK